MPETEDLNGKVRRTQRLSGYCHLALMRLIVCQYLIPWARLGPVRKETQDPVAGGKLCDWLEEQVKDV